MPRPVTNYHYYKITIDDMSSLANKQDEPVSRKEQNRRNKAAQRQREKEAGQATITITLSAQEYTDFLTMRDTQSGPIDTFAKRAFLTGCKFCANSGNVRGGKKKIRSNTKEPATTTDHQTSISDHESDHGNPAHVEDAPETGTCAA